MDTLHSLERRISYALNGRRQIGTLPMLEWLHYHYGAKLGLPKPAAWHVHPHVLPFPIDVALGGTSDVQVFTQIFIIEEYNVLRGLPDISFIVDLGANVGYSSAYLLSCFPQAAVLAVEPNARNFAIAQKTLEPFGARATLLHGAVWSEPTRLCLSGNPNQLGHEWGTRVAPPADGQPAEVQAWDIPTLLRIVGRQRINLLKIDIEGAEKFIFCERACEWLPLVDNICVELHGSDCEEAFFSALNHFDYTLSRSYELAVCTGIHARQSPHSVH